MTHEQLVAAARELCRLRGLDPDDQSDYPPEAKLWQVAVLEVERFAEVGQALAAVAALPEGKPARKTRARTRA